MGEVWRSLSAGGRFPAGVPTVGIRAGTTQFARLSDEIKHMMMEAAADGINDLADRIARDSLVEVPKEDMELANSIRAPFNDPESRATAEYMVASISYNTPYADVQHEGVWTIVHHHPIIPGRQGFFEREDQEAEIVIEWKAERYTTPGTKSHFLSDPYKAHVLEMEMFIAKSVRRRFGTLPIIVD